MYSEREKSTTGTRASSSYKRTMSSNPNDDRFFLRKYNNKKITKCQSHTSEISEFVENTELAERFKPKKTRSILLSQSYARLAGSGESFDMTFKNKSDRVSECASFLQFEQNLLPSGVVEDKKYLTRAYFCHDNLCPCCAWRRSIKSFAQVFQIADSLKSEYKFLLLTLTIRNVSSDELSDSIDRLLKSFHNFIRYKRIQTAVSGFYRKLEVTYNKKADTFHPHFHVLLCVKKEYASYDDNSYIKHGEWLELWRRAYGDESITNVNIKRVYSKDGSDNVAAAVAEVAKYACKDADYLIEDDNVKTDYLVLTLSRALRGRRLSSYGGIMKELFHKFKFEDVESDDADFLSGEDSGLRDDCNHVVTVYRFNHQKSDYEEIDTFVTTPEERQRYKDRASPPGFS